MGQDDALGRAGRTRGVDDPGTRVRVEQPVVVGLDRCRARLGVGVGIQCGGQVGGRSGVWSADRPDRERRASRERLGEPVELIGRSEHHGRIDRVDGGHQLRRRVAGVAERQDAPRARDGVQGDQCVELVVGDHHDPLAGCGDGRDPLGQRDDPAAQGREGDVAVVDDDGGVVGPVRRGELDDLVEQHGGSLANPWHRGPSERE